MSVRNEPLLELIQSMSKAEKRNFRLYTTRMEDNRDAKFMTLFDILDRQGTYDEQAIMDRCGVAKQQIPNLKAHLYKQILSSIRMLNVRHSEVMQLREALDFAEILYDKGLYRQCERMADRAREQARRIEQHSASFDITELDTKLGRQSVTHDMTASSDAGRNTIQEICSQIETIGELQSTSTRIYSLYQQLRYARTQKDIRLIKRYFGPRLAEYGRRQGGMSFHERFYYYQASAWYYYIQHDFARSYRYSRKWVELFHEYPRMKRVLYDDYLKGWGYIMDGLYLMRKYRYFVQYLDRFDRELPEIAAICTNARIIGGRIFYVHKMHKCFIEGEFGRGITIIGEAEDFMNKYSSYLDIHYKMMMYYNIALIWFGDGNYIKCMEYLARITSTKDHQIRRDLQCFARILNLIASYEAGMDYNLDSQIRSVYTFLVKMNDMGVVQQEMLSFLKRLNTIYAGNLKDELRILYERLRPYENRPFERRPFYYLDILSWLESKITGQTVGEIIRRKFKQEMAR